ncbi:MAG: cysteine desulfurase family protein [bacterium]|nr:cysteine desulfurase family protein [bacterium]
MSIASKRSIYLDNAAATPLDPRVKQEMSKALELCGNPSSFNDVGREARDKLEKSRSVVARFLGSRPEEIIFTSSGSEANNLAILGLTKIYKKPAEIIATSIEHPSVLELLKVLKYQGWKITYLKVDPEGFVNLKDLEEKLNPEVVLVSIIYANNEIGTIQPIFKISKILKDFNKKLEIENWKLKIRETKRVLFHVDACQATGYLEMNVNNLGVDLVVFNGSKIYGPKGVGVLYKKRRVSLQPLICGGNQEHGLRAGTENLPAIVGLAKAVSLIEKREGVKMSKLRDYFLDKVGEIMPDVKINGSLGNKRLANNINISLPNLDSESLLLELDKYGVYASSGSACTARSVEPSHVLKAIGVEKKYIHGALRFSLGRQTTRNDLNRLLKVLPKIVINLKKRYKK